MSDQEMPEVVHPGDPHPQSDEAYFLARDLEDRAWRRGMAAKAPEILATLRQHVPGDVWLEVEDYLDTHIGLRCFGETLRRERERAELRRRLPAEYWPEIEDYLNTRIAMGEVGEAVSAMWSDPES
jgi:hypothetical protein